MTASSAVADVAELIRQAEQANAAGDRDRASTFIAQARARDPEHPAVLNATAMQSVQQGHLEQARALLERAVELDRASTRYWMNLAGTLRRLGEREKEMQALERVLAIEPRHLLALLQKGALLELQGKIKAAARVYHNGLRTVAPGTRLPTAIQGLVQHAITKVQENDSALETFLAQRLLNLRQEHASQDHERFDHCIDVLLGRRQIYTPQPTFLHFPKLPALEFFPREHFPWLTELEAASNVILEEFTRVFTADSAELEPYIAYPEGVPLDQWAALNHSRRWSAFYLWRDGKPVTDHLARCPQTAQLLERLPMLDIPGYAPTAFFSILDARSHIPPHTGVTNTRVITHLPLVVPSGCRFRAGSQTREWKTGEAWVFDDSLEHEAWNDSDAPRAILIFDIWNPHLSDAERDLLRQAVSGIKEYYQQEALISAST